MASGKALETGLVYPRNGSRRVLATQIKKYLQGSGVNTGDDAQRLSLGTGSFAKKSGSRKRAAANVSRAGS